MLEQPSLSFSIWKYIRHWLQGMAFLMSVDWEELVQGPALLNFPPWFSLLLGLIHMSVEYHRCWAVENKMKQYIFLS